MDTYVFKVYGSNSSSSGGTFQVVKLAGRTCSCGEFQKHQLPCIHACAGAMKSREQVEQFLHQTYLLSKLRRVYAGIVVPIDVETLDEDMTWTSLEIKQVGRPCKDRL